VLNEIVRLTFKDDTFYNVLGHEMDGVNIWIAFKLLIIMPLSGIYAWLLTKTLAKHHMPAPVAIAADPAPITAAASSRSASGSAPQADEHQGLR
jgi:intracellular septation protein